LVIKALDPDWIRIRIGLQPQTLDPDPEKMNTDPKPWYQGRYGIDHGTYVREVILLTNLSINLTDFLKTAHEIQIWFLGNTRKRFFKIKITGTLLH
jgi:hypothetical protein